jgi:hypothetical protein
MMEVAGTQHPMYIGSECPGDHVHRGPSTTGWNDSSAGSVEASVILEATADRDTPRNTPQKKKYFKTKGTNTKNEKECNGFTTPAPPYTLSKLDKNGQIVTVCMPRDG